MRSIGMSTGLGRFGSFALVGRLRRLGRVSRLGRLSRFGGLGQMGSLGRVGALGRVDRSLLGIAGVLVVATAVEMAWPHRLTTEGARPAEVEAPAAVHSEPLAPPAPIGSYLAISDRPLFTVGRRPYVPPPEEPVHVARAQPVAAPPRINFELTAVVSTPTAKLTLLRTDRSPGILKLAVGERHEAWTLVDVQPHAVVLRNGNETTTVTLNPDEDPQSTPREESIARSAAEPQR